ncbi:UTP--glucose-1-phosphate uridylyltransferase GalU [Anaerotalea alkaliphila]|uniref:UTP--glucose-1-phosphate uridylyltransferase n=1 Tax=Anaerotalea alkaliphila TaxID=2662126 RepID=A0A7X5KNG9_9FIRM|nr:UTP--glucose-1-phosphate uridylyltransferase GalU [Anaerotalea alkaliphila]NDL67788.1 UTP--glucose-1-phosphate uridylyltransferase GalU [Anaerotalea alkaliphila]
MKIKKAIIPAAGLGTRFLPATKAQPKEMLPIVDKPTIQYIVEEAVKSGIEDIIIVTGRNKRSIEDHFDRNIELEMALEEGGKEELLHIVQEATNLANIHYIRQKEPRGLGHAILTAKNFIGNEPFAVLLGDDIVVSKKPCLLQLIEAYNEYKTTILGVQDVPPADVCKYGIVESMVMDEGITKVKSLVEKPPVGEAPSTLAILGRYIVTPRIFHYLESQTPGAGGEIQLTDALMRLAQEEAMYTLNFKGKRYDVGNQLGFISATVEFALRRDDLRDEVKGYLEGLMADMEGTLRFE